MAGRRRAPRVPGSVFPPPGAAGGGARDGPLDGPRGERFRRSPMLRPARPKVPVFTGTIGLEPALRDFAGRRSAPGSGGLLEAVFGPWIGFAVRAAENADAGHAGVGKSQSSAAEPALRGDPADMPVAASAAGALIGLAGPVDQLISARRRVVRERTVTLDWPQHVVTPSAELSLRLR